MYSRWWPQVLPPPPARPAAHAEQRLSVQQRRAGAQLWIPEERVLQALPWPRLSDPSQIPAKASDLAASGGIHAAAVGAPGEIPLVHARGSAVVSSKILEKPIKSIFPLKLPHLSGPQSREPAGGRQRTRRRGHRWHEELLVPHGADGGSQRQDTAAWGLPRRVGGQSQEPPTHQQAGRRQVPPGCGRPGAAAVPPADAGSGRGPAARAVGVSPPVRPAVPGEGALHTADEQHQDPGRVRGRARVPGQLPDVCQLLEECPIKKDDNLRVSGSEGACEPSPEVPEYRDKFIDPPKHVAKEKSLKTDDHLRPRGEFTKEIPEYHESFRDPHITEMPERGKPREPFLRLRGKIEFNPEYRNNYQDFPRSRPVVQKPTSCFRLPTSGVNHASSVHHQADQGEEETPVLVTVPPSEVTATPEYRRAQYNYQLRERPRELEAAPPGMPGNIRKSSDSSLEARQPQAPHKRRTSRQRGQIKEPVQPAAHFEEVGGNAAKKPARYGRRASVLQNAANCRDNSSIIEGIPSMPWAVAARSSRSSSSSRQEPLWSSTSPASLPTGWRRPGTTPRSKASTPL